MCPLVPAVKEIPAELGTATVPSEFVPIRLLAMKVPEVADVAITIPLVPAPEIRLFSIRVFWAP